MQLPGCKWRVVPNTQEKVLINTDTGETITFDDEPERPGEYLPLPTHAADGVWR